MAQNKLKRFVDASNKLSEAMKGNTNAAKNHVRSNGQEGVSSSNVVGGRGVVYPPFVQPTPKSFPTANKVGRVIGGIGESISKQSTGAYQGAKAGFSLGANVESVKNVFKGQRGTVKGLANEVSGGLSAAVTGAKLGRKAGAVVAKISSAGEAAGGNTAERWMRKADSVATDVKWGAIDAKDRAKTSVEASVKRHLGGAPYLADEIKRDVSRKYEEVSNKARRSYYEAKHKLFGS